MFPIFKEERCRNPNRSAQKGEESKKGEQRAS